MDYKICDYFHIYDQKFLVMQETGLKEARMVSHVSKVIKYTVITSPKRSVKTSTNKIQDVPSVPMRQEF